MKIAIQGEAGSFHDEAANQYYKNQKISIINYRSFKEVFLAVKNNKANFGLVAIENSLYGSINEVYDLLSQYGLAICGEISLRIEHFLLATPGTTLETIEEIYSQSPALAQCETYLDSHLPHADRIDYFDTAAGAKYVAKAQSPKLAAIASLQASKIYNLDVLAKNIETDKNNYTRFIVIGKNNLTNLLKSPKTSIMFSTNNKPGALYSVLKLFADANINLTKIESRPILHMAWHYYYYLDFEGNKNSPAIVEILAKLKDISANLRVLGCYESNTFVG